MNIEKFTDRAKGFLQSAQTVAIRNDNQRVAPEHLLKALLEDEEGMASNLIRAAGGRPETAMQATDLAIAKIAKVTGAGAQNLQWDNDTVRILDNAEQIATKAGDSFVPVERVLMASPTDARTSYCMPSTSTTTWMHSRSRSAIDAGSTVSSMSSTRIANSSPPRRATVSPGSRALVN